MSLFDEFGEFWYEAGLAKSNRFRCIAAGCNEIIPKGDLQIGILCEDKNDCHGWYHPECLWESFNLKLFKANPRITQLEDIKNHGALSAEIQHKIQHLIDQAKTNEDNKRALFDENVEQPPETPIYAMSGTVSVKLDKNQNIYISGDVGHIGGKLASHGAFFKEYNNTGWMFSCSERAGARKFLCMPDELPKVNKPVALDLADLGRQHAAAEGTTVTEAEQRDADTILRLHNAKPSSSAYKRARK